MISLALECVRLRLLHRAIAQDHEMRLAGVPPRVIILGTPLPGKSLILRFSAVRVCVQTPGW